MKPLGWRALILVLLVAPGFALRAAESTGAAESSSEVYWKWANFLLLAGGLGYIIKKNAGPFFAKRSTVIRQGMIEADEARAEADAKVADVERRLARLQADIEALRRDALQEGEAEAQRMQREGAAEMAKIRQNTAEEIASAGKAARLELRRYSAELALGLAEQKIRARMSPATQSRLITSFLAHLGRS